mmetsp:Transcript_14526/g.26690  ORF Transcript_14526/g.26690 Transcript_14526/m.26690 type:complete len:320 (-) Transcript_14526:39-998(-)
MTGTKAAGSAVVAAAGRVPAMTAGTATTIAATAATTMATTATRQCWTTRPEWRTTWQGNSASTSSSARLPAQNPSCPLRTRCPPPLHSLQPLLPPPPPSCRPHMSCRRQRLRAPWLPPLPTTGTTALSSRNPTTHSRRRCHRPVSPTPPTTTPALPPRPCRHHPAPLATAAAAAAVVAAVAVAVLAVGGATTLWARTLGQVGLAVVARCVLSRGGAKLTVCSGAALPRGPSRWPARNTFRLARWPCRLPFGSRWLSLTAVWQRRCWGRLSSGCAAWAGQAASPRGLLAARRHEQPFRLRSALTSLTTVTTTRPRRRRPF